MKTKRFLSVLLAVFALVCVVGLTATSVSAATEIQGIFVYNVPNLMEGEDLSTEYIWIDGYWEDAETSNYSAECWNAEKTVIQWTKNGEPATEYTPGEEIVLNIHLECAEGYTIADDLFTDNIPGAELEVSEGVIDITWTYVEFAYAQSSESVYPPIPEPGMETEANGESFEVPVQIDPEMGEMELHYTVSGQWMVYDYATGEYTPFSGTFEEGYIYSLRLTVLADEGYMIPYCYVQVNDQWAEWQEEDGVYTYDVVYSFVQETDHVQIGELPEAVIGEAAADFEVEVYSGNATASGEWLVLDYETGEYVPFTGTFEDGKLYRRVVTLRPTAGYAFGEQVGVECSDGSGWYTWAEDPMLLTLDTEYSFRPEIDEIVINGVTDAVIGEDATVEGITVPEDAPYTIEVVRWMVYTEFEYEFEPGVVETWYDYEAFEGTFEDGKKYQLYIVVNLDQQYEFADDVVVLVNGEEAGHAWGGRVEVVYSFQEVIDKIEVTMPEPEIGKPVYGEITAGEHITVNQSWHEVVSRWGEWQYIEPEAGVVFEDGKRYNLRLELSPEFGYEFSEDAVLYINGEEYDDVYISSTGNYCDVDFDVSFVDIIDTITVTGAPEAVAGEKATVEGIKIPENAGYEFSAYWFNETTEEALEEGAVFEKGNAYRLIIEVTTLAGYEFDEDTTMTVDGKKVGWVDYWSGVAGAELYHSLLTPVESIVITGVPEAVVGEKATVEGIEVPENAPYELEAVWFVDGETMEEGDVFEDGKHYYLYIELDPAKGYEFSEDATLTVNGEEPEDYYVGTRKGYAQFEYNFADLIEKVEITLTEPAVGETIDPSTIKVPEDAPYEIELDELIVMDAVTGEPATGKYEDGHKYVFLVVALAKEGYECNADTVVTVNGKEVEIYQYESQGVAVILEYTFREVIEKVEITDVPEAVVGETAEDVELTVPEDAPYTAIGTWVVYDEYGYGSFNGKFEEGQVYRLQISIVAKEGYELSSETTVITINGETYLGKAESETFGNTLDVNVSHALGLKVIDKIELTIPELVVGEKLPELEAIVLPEGVGCELEYLYWYSSKTDDINDYNGAKATVKDGLYYACRVEFYAEDGYVFADDLVVVANGETVEYNDMYDYVEAYRVNYIVFTGLVCDHVAGEHEHSGAGHWSTCTKCGETLSEGEHVYTDDKDATCDTCGYKRDVKNPDPNPDTGDAFAPVAVLVMLVSLAAVVSLNKRRIF